MARRISGKVTGPVRDEYAGGWPRPQAITPVGTEVRVNTATQFDQIGGKGAALAGGGFVVVWNDASTSGGATGDTSGAVKLQLFDANAGKVGTEILVNTATASSQGRGAVTALTNGGFVVTWEDYSLGVGGATGDNDQAAVKAQIFTAAGVKVGVEILVNSNPAGDQIAGPPVALSGGGFVVSWNTFDGNQGESFNLRAEVFAADGTRVATGLAVDEGFNSATTIIALDGNRFAVLWTEIGASSPTVIGDRDVQMRIYDGNGVPAGPSFAVNAADANWQILESVAKVAGGGFVVTWEEQDPGGSFSEIMAQRFDVTGAKLGGEFLVNTVTASYQSGSQVSGLSGGGFVITWTSQDVALGNEVRAQVYNAAGVAIGTELNVNTATASAQQSARVVALASGGFVVVWDDSSQGVGGATGDNNGRAIKGQEYDAAGTPVGSEFLVNTAIRERQQITDVIALPNGRFAVIWDDASQGLGGATGDTSGLQVKLQVLQGTATTPPINGTTGPDDITGTSGNDTINGLDGDDTLHGGLGTDTLNGGNGTDILRGDDGNDTLFGNDGNDFLVGGPGNDIMVGGLGDDTYYVDSTSDAIGEQAGEGNDRVAVTITLALAADADIERIEVENLTSTNAIDLTGSAIANVIYGNDGQNILRGEAGNDELRGFGGDDFLVGGPGTDLMVGGLGNDTFYVDDASDAIGEIAGQGNDRIAASVSFVLSNGADVEVLEAVNVGATTAFDLTGSDSNNTITGNAGVNILRGEGGSDVLSGAGGDDFLVGGAGNDVMNGGTGSDTYYVDAAGDVVNEFAGEGAADRVVASVTYALSATADVELLETATQTGTGALDLTGSSIANTINGNDGANILDGKGGSDVLTGFGGADTFQFTTALGANNVDTILGFVTGSDRIALDDAVFAGIGPVGALNANAFFAGTAAHDADDRIIYNSATGALLFDADGNGAGAAVQFATIGTGLNLAASDFMVI